MSRNTRNRASCFLLIVFLIAVAGSRVSAATLDDLKKLDIICFVPSYLPKGFQLRSVQITYDDAGPDEQVKRRVPLYSLEYGNGKAAFSIESAWEGIGDRNLMEEEDSEETEFKSPLFGPVYIIYRPKKNGKNAVKDEIRANWVEDANMKAEMAKAPKSHPILGRFHGLTGTGITVEEFKKIVNSLHPIKEKTNYAARNSPGSARKH